MSVSPTPKEVFARTLLALQPYADEVVLIGGWVHALYLAESNHPAHPIYTTDIDFSIPHALVSGTRPALLDLVAQAGYETSILDSRTGVRELWQQVRDGSIVDLDLLTDAPDPNLPVAIEGQRELVVHGYPDQHLLLENSRSIDVGPDVHPLLDPPIRVRVPTVPAYVLVKGLSFQRRPGRQKMAKDLVYLFEIVRDHTMRQAVIGGMGDLAARAPHEYSGWRRGLADAAENRSLMADVADQLEEMLRVTTGLAELPQYVATHLRRLLAETPQR